MNACQQAGRHLSLSQDGCNACGWERPWRYPPVQAETPPATARRKRRKQ